VADDVDEALGDRGAEGVAASRPERVERLRRPGDADRDAGVASGGDDRKADGDATSWFEADVPVAPSRATDADSAWSAAQSRPTIRERSCRMAVRSRSSTGPDPAVAIATRWLRAVSCSRAMARTS
jgi:hypothetical protein